jgi:rod shape determining protein RodA
MAKENIFLIDNTNQSHFDWATFWIAMSLIAYGLVCIYSATYDSSMSSFFDKQLMSAGIGFIFMIGLSFIPESWLKASSYIIFGMTLVLLALLPFIGHESNGTKGWIRLGGFSLQPSEIAKISLILVLARHLSLKGTDIQSFRDLGVTALLSLIPVAMIVAQPDFGSATVLIVLFVGVVFWAGFDSFILYFFFCLPFIMVMSWISPIIYYIGTSIMSAGVLFFRRKIYFSIIAIAVFFAVGFYGQHFYEVLEPHQKKRIDTFIKADADPRGAGYNVLQSILAVGSGGLTGKGYLQGTQTQLRYIPMQWTDFIFSVPNEEFGFIGGALAILLHVALILRAIKIAYDTDSKFYSVMCIGIATVLFYHITINIGMAIGIMPVMGIPLPFMSQGGTALIINMAMVGLLLNAQRYYKLKRVV